MDLDRFTEAQSAVWQSVLAELRAGRKASHWMWFVFPQHRSLGQSAMAQRYGLAGLAEARAYLEHPVLGPRLNAATDAAMGSGEADPVALFGTIDALKFRSCLTLFREASSDAAPFQAALDRFYGGAADEATLDLLQA